jgi:ATP-dependent protease HslVU (ClpYQ) peptidase subunit
MTCIVAVTDHRTVVMGADSASTGEHDLHIRATPKLFRTGPYAIGYTRSWRMGQILRHVTELPEPPDTTDGDALEHFLVAELIPAIRQSFHAHGFAKTSRVARTADYTEEGQEVSGVFLVGLAGHVFEIREDYQVVRPATPYAAVGAGAITALGALHALHEHTDVELRARAEIALAAAETYTQSVRRPFHFLEL